jgi:hypothetical protein
MLLTEIAKKMCDTKIYKNIQVTEAMIQQILLRKAILEKFPI